MDWWNRKLGLGKYVIIRYIVKFHSDELLYTVKFESYYVCLWYSFWQRSEAHGIWALFNPCTVFAIQPIVAKPDAASFSATLTAAAGSGACRFRQFH